MQKWEYLQVIANSRNFATEWSRGRYFSDEDFKAIDPEGKPTNGFHWSTAMTNTMFLAVILDELGTEGWEAVGNIDSGVNDTKILLKRPIE